MINPSEITIGSILRTNKGEIIRVESISTKRQHRKVGYHREEDPFHIHYVRLAQCEGIPLTEEILEANDIRYQFGRLWWQKADPFGNPNQYEVHINNVTTVIVDDVHQLQDALRLCGLDRIASNLTLPADTGITGAENDNIDYDKEGKGSRG